ncbi:MULTISPECIES: hypothetical protein [Nitrospirillum]|uniref:Uncharacterized protein n=1 Tax=Nitrospirillum amazonense TaxID=28077 RepID=A0A560G5C4_9PROT|nr:hypothetical protein [Nitrospirillum amazonense]MEC4592875.1 hypothetical protein [Nitrospirillum amazonense]TWB29032.1 hypothetical protein FBZ88_104197 [Nitrospirillum amazonense]
MKDDIPTPKPSPPLALLCGKLVTLLLLAYMALFLFRPGVVLPDGRDVRMDQETILARAVVLDGQLWLLTDSGRLSRIAIGGSTRIPEPLPEPAAGLCVLDNRLLVLTGGRYGTGPWTLRHQSRDGWATLATVPTEGDRAMALDCTGRVITVLTDHRIIHLDGAAVDVVPLSEPLEMVGVVAATYGTPDHLFVGLNAGEWGGGLRRIDRRTGRMKEINPEFGRAGSLPVNAVLPLPWRSDCLALAVGLIHFSADGGLAQLCGDVVDTLYRRPYVSPNTHGLVWQLRNGAPNYNLVAFYGLASDGDSLWASGTGGLYRLSSQGPVRHVPLPAFRKIGGLWISFDHPHLVLIVADQRKAIGSYGPLLVSY